MSRTPDEVYADILAEEGQAGSAARAAELWREMGVVAHGAGLPTWVSYAIGVIIAYKEMSADGTWRPRTDGEQS